MKLTRDNLSVLELAVHANNTSVVKYWVSFFTKKNDADVKKYIESAPKIAKAMPGRDAIVHILKNLPRHNSTK